MNVIVEKRPIVGTLKTLLGTYQLLDDRQVKYGDYFRFYAVDDEGFNNYILVYGDFVVIPAQVISQVDVKRVLTEQEAQGVEILTAATID